MGRLKHWLQKGLVAFMILMMVLNPLSAAASSAEDAPSENAETIEAEVPEEGEILSPDDMDYYLEHKIPFPDSLSKSETSNKLKASNGTVTYVTTVSNGGSYCAKFKVKGKDAFCAQQPLAVPPTGTAIKSISLVTNAKMRKALYYGYGGPKAQVKKNDQGWVKTSIALSKANGYTAGYPVNWDFYESLDSLASPPASFKVYLCDTGNGYQDLCYWIYEPQGKLTLKKTSTSSHTSNNSNYSLAGCVVGVYANKACTTRVGTLTTTASGTSNTLSLPPAKYYYKELTAPKGFQIDSTVRSITITDQSSKTITLSNAPKRGNLKIVKASANPDVTEGNSKYSLAGAVYGVYRGYTGGTPTGLVNGVQTYRGGTLSSKVGTVTTKSDGTATAVLIADTFYVKEEKAPPGYELDDRVYKVSVPVSPLKILNVEDEPKLDPVSILLRKIDKETREPYPVGAGSLAGAQFEIKFYHGTDWSEYENPADFDAVPVKTWIFETNSNGFINFDEESKISGDEFWYDATDMPLLPEGTVTIQEIKPPEGYLIDDTIYTRVITPDVSVGAVTFNEPIVAEQVILGDLEFRKVDSKTKQPLPGVEFDIISKTTGETVRTIVTDENGYATTASAEKPDGTLPYDTYIIHEVTPLPGYLPMEDVEVEVTEHSKIVDAGTFENKGAAISTAAVARDTQLHITFPDSEVTIDDTVSYENLIEGQVYTLKGYLMDEETGDYLLTNGEKVEHTFDFEAEGSSGSVVMSFTLDASALSGKTIVVFEELYLDDIKIAGHTDINDENQSVHFLNPAVTTKAVVTETGTNVAFPNEEVEITDTISYTDLVPGLEYHAIGYLVDKETGETYFENGEEVCVVTYFTPEETAGTVSSTFKIDARELQGRSFVVYQEIYCGNTYVTEHKDLTDENQTIHFPKIGTTALDSESKTHTAEADGEVTIIDTIEYKNLVPGKPCTISGILINQSDGKPLLVDGKEITAQIEFTPENADGTVQLAFFFDGSTLGGKSVVVYESLLYDGVEVAAHADINDAGQTVSLIAPEKTIVPTGDRSYSLPWVALFILATVSIGILQYRRKGLRD